MCCFSGNVTFVQNTRIFARMIEAGQQGLVYQMNVGAPADLAMILPLPVAPDSKEDAVKFIDLSGYPKFFSHLRAAFPIPLSNRAGSDSEPPSASPAAQLKVHEVGSYEASFVPKLADFARLDARFRLPDEVWKNLPQFADYGFAVFKLKQGDREIHPMAFTFPTRHPAKLFFPTVHIHDGQVHAEEEFDHDLYCQVRKTGLFAMTRWEESSGPAQRTCNIEASKGLLAEGQHLHRLPLTGKHKNEDILLETA
jgi:hypothetical protein